MTRRGGFLGLSKRAAYDIIVKRIPGVAEEYACYTFYAVKGGSTRSSTAVFAETAVKEVVKQFFDYAITSMSPVYSMAKDLSDALGSGSIDTKGIYSRAAKLGGAMQLHAARGMGKDVYDQCRIFGLSASVKFGGAVRFEIKEGLRRQVPGDQAQGLEWIDGFCRVGR